MAKQKGSSKETVVGRITIWLLKLLIAFFVLSLAGVLFYSFVPVYYTPLMFIRMYEQHSRGEKTRLDHQWVPIDKISPNVPLAAMAGEDAKFLDHNGFDEKAIVKAIEHNKKGKSVHGASTITQQVAKNVYLFPSRIFLRKGLEVYFTMLIELCWSKERIMEVYLNSIEMGDGIYGIEAAAKHYYGCSASELNKKQAATIVSCFPSPIKRTPDHMTKEALRHRRQILKGMTYLKSVKFD